MNTPTEVDIAWAAGLFEGEGTWIVRQPKGKGNPTAAIVVQMCDKDVVERFAAVMGCGTVKIERRANPLHSDLWRWQTAKRRECKRIAEMLLPHLGERRTQRAREVIAAASSVDLRSDRTRYAEAMRKRAQPK